MYVFQKSTVAPCKLLKSGGYLDRCLLHCHKCCWPGIFVGVHATAGNKMHTFFFLMELAFYKGVGGGGYKKKSKYQTTIISENDKCDETGLKKIGFIVC